MQFSTYVDQNREGDHICYISDLAKFRAHYPGWNLTRRVEDIVHEMICPDVHDVVSPASSAGQS